MIARGASREVRHLDPTPSRGDTARLADPGRLATERAADDSLQLLLLCCHPSLTRPSQVALTLRAVSGLSTPQIAAAFLVPEATMAQRLSRAKATVHAREARFELPEASALPERVAAVLDVLYLVFNQGYMRSGGHSLVDTSLTQEAIRLTRQLHRHLPDHDEVAGALALMMLTEARQAARVDDRGDLIPLSEQDRQLWDEELIAEGVGILELVLPRWARRSVPASGRDRGRPCRIPHLAGHRLAPDQPPIRDAPTHSPQPSRHAQPGRRGQHEPRPPARTDHHRQPAHRPDHATHHRTHAVRGHLLETAGDLAGAADEYCRAAQLTASLPEQRYLNARAQRARCHNEARKSAPEDATPRDLGGLTPDSR